MASRALRAGPAAGGATASSMMEDLSLNEAGAGRSAYLTPLQRSLVYELTTRRRQIADAQREVDFWREHDQRQGEGMADGQTRRRDTFGKEVVDAAFLDDLIAQRRARIAELRQMNALKQAIIHSADAAHSINASMAAVPPAGYGAETPLCFHTDVKSDRQPLRSLVARRDQLALQFLRLDQQNKSLRAERRRLAQEIASVRGQTAALVQDIEGQKQALNQQRERQTKRLNKTGDAGDKEVQKRIESLREALAAARGKRMMMKGVLRGILLESGMQWSADPKAVELMLSLADDELESSDEEVDLYDE